MGSHGAPPLKYAITKSCDGYYYRLGLKMGIDGLVKMVEDFEYDKRTGVDLPNEKISRTPKYYRKTVEKRYGGRWVDIETVFASIGQVTTDDGAAIRTPRFPQAVGRDRPKVDPDGTPSRTKAATAVAGAGEA